MTISRREFLSSLLTGSGAVALGGGLSSVSFTSKANENEAFSDYKALVCVMLHGGNDAINTVVPIATSDKAYSYENYVLARSELLTINASPLNYQFNADGLLQSNPYYVDGTASGKQNASSYIKGYYPLAGMDEIGLNALMPEMAKRFNDGELSIVANVGNLITPTSKEQFTDKAHPLPPFLMAHNHQRRAMHTGWGDNLAASGWAGRIADVLAQMGKNPSPNGFDMNISYSGATRMLEGDDQSYLVLGLGDINNHKGSEAQTSLQSALLDLDANDETIIPMRRHVARKQQRSINLLAQLDNAWTGLGDPFGAVSGVYGEALFTPPTAAQAQLDDDVVKGLCRQLETVAKMITLNQQAGNAMGLQRQIFYVTLGGFDHHAGQSEKHPSLLRALSTGLEDFYRAMESQGLKEQVATFTMSDFGRTVLSNGDGTDHAWGGHHFVMGGGVKGGLVGQLPDIALDSDDDYNGKGRLIPSTAQDQLSATMTKWFGIEDAAMASIFPNLNHFIPDGKTGINSAYLHGLFAGLNNEA